MNLPLSDNFAIDFLFGELIGVGTVKRRDKQSKIRGEQQLDKWINMKIKITYETERLLVLRNRVRTRAWCEECKTETDFIPNEDVNGLEANLNQEKEKQILHKLNLPDGKTLVCLASLLKKKSEK